MKFTLRKADALRTISFYLALFSLLVALFALTYSLTAQTAKVIQLSAEDATEAKSLDDQMKALVAKQEAFRKSILEKYLVIKTNENGSQEYSPGGIYSNFYYDSLCFMTLNSSRCSEPTKEEKAKAERERKEYEAKRRWIRSGWYDGKYIYSDDYKFIVPAPIVPMHNVGTSLCPNWIYGSTTPATTNWVAK